MKSVCAVALGLVAALAVAVSLQAADKGDKGDKGEVTLKGKMVCGKCTLKETDACTNVLQVEKDGKTVNYYLDDDGKSADYHKGICPPNKSVQATVTGTVTEKDGKQHIKPTKVDVADSKDKDKDKESK